MGYSSSFLLLSIKQEISLVGVFEGFQGICFRIFEFVTFFLIEDFSTTREGELEDGMHSQSTVHRVRQSG